MLRYDLAESEMVIYIGTHKLVGILASMTVEPKLLAHSVRFYPEGFNNGLVANLERAMYSIESLIQTLLSQVNSGVSKWHPGISVYVVLGNAKLKTFSFASSLCFQGFQKTIAPSDVSSVIDQTKSVATLPLSEHVLQTLPISFIVNDLEDIRDPLGLEAQRIGVRLKIFTMSFHDFKNISKVFETAEIEVQGYYPKTLTASSAILNKQERDEGGILIDISHHATFIILWKKNEIINTKVLEIGDRYLIDQIGKEWEIDYQDADRVKDRFGSLEMNLTFGDELIPLLMRDGKESLQVHRQTFHQKFLEHAKCWLEMILREAGQFASEERLYHPRYVFTGSGSSMDGFLEFLQKQFMLEGRIGHARRIEAAQDVLVNPALAGALGMLSWIAYEETERNNLYQPRGFFRKTLANARDWFSTYF
ncbi:MAG: hypothetical protein PHN49_02250 [Candidatus Omnitrophica bacterium]|nr:hypothetical protein [Candidatus Omnitrophota bacterium]MDD5670441.1 hypothetical protein [Candidatus Omnitrophota bacterium]